MDNVVQPSVSDHQNVEPAIDRTAGFKVSEGSCLRSFINKKCVSKPRNSFVIVHAASQ